MLIFILFHKKNDDKKFSLDIMDDSSILNSDEDLLEMKKDADDLYKKIISISNNRQSITFVINSTWGTGKTSFLNLVKEDLLKDNYSVITFNPWKYSHNSNYTELFFKQLYNETNIFNNKTIVIKYLKTINAINNNYFT